MQLAGGIASRWLGLNNGGLAMLVFMRQVSDMLDVSLLD
jgi:hypothetical protein